jgi:hypothetical protein
VAIDGPGREQLRALAARLKDAGEEGKGLRKELLKQLEAAAKPLAREIGSAPRLRPYMPDRYADVLAADLAVTVQRQLSANPRVLVTARGRNHKRKVVQLEDGVIVHPVYAQGPRRQWNWKNGRQTAGMKRGWFSDPVQAAGPDVRDRALEAVAETMRKVAGGGS